ALLGRHVLIEEIDLGAEAEPAQLAGEKPELAAEVVTAGLRLEEQRVACGRLLVGIVARGGHDQEHDRDRGDAEVDEDRGAVEVAMQLPQVPLVQRLRHQPAPRSVRAAMSPSSMSPAGPPGSALPP